MVVIVVSVGSSRKKLAKRVTCLSDQICLFVIYSFRERNSAFGSEKIEIDSVNEISLLVEASFLFFLMTGSLDDRFDLQFPMMF